MGGSRDPPKQCGLGELFIFLAAIITGTACAICSKTMMRLQSTGIDGTTEVFNKPIFQTLGMFVGMIFGLVMHWIVLLFRIPFPGYEHDDASSLSGGKDQQQQITTTTTMTSSTRSTPYGAIVINDAERGLLLPPKSLPVIPPPPPSQSSATIATTTTQQQPTGTPTWMYFFLMIPSIFDLAATAFCMMGLQYIDVSIYMLLRGSGIIFIAIMKQHVLGDHLYTFQWIGVFWNVVSVLLVGATAILDSSQEEVPTTAGPPGSALLGVCLVLAGAFIQALQFVFEEKVMTMDESAVSPLLLIGMEGLWGTVLCLLVVYPLVYYLPGDDHGSYEDPFNTWVMIQNSAAIKASFVIYFIVIFAYNLFAVMVTFFLSSIWHAILDNFRPILGWIVDLMIYYTILSMASTSSTGSDEDSATKAAQFGEAWTRYSFIQLFGMFVLLFGTAVYNAPNAGSIKLLGQWYSFGWDLSKEYEEIEQKIEEAAMEEEWESRKASFAAGVKRHSSFAERSPHISVHTQALRGLASPKI